MIKKGDKFISIDRIYASVRGGGVDTTYEIGTRFTYDRSTGRDQHVMIAYDGKEIDWATSKISMLLKPVSDKNKLGQFDRME